MSSALTSIITASDPNHRNQCLDTYCSAASLEQLLEECQALEKFRHQSENLYERVRALFFLYAIHRFHLSSKAGLSQQGRIPFSGYTHLLQRRFTEAIGVFLRLQSTEGPSDALSSALAAAYYRLGIQTLADQVRRSVRSARGNQWMFRMGHPADHPLRLRPELLNRNPNDLTYPVLRERTPVRMDLTHSAWSDIFFLGMDFPEGARVLNISIDLGIHGRDTVPGPPVEAFFRVIDEPLLRLTSVDLGASADIIKLDEVFDFARDYLGLLKAALIAAGIIPPGVEGSGQKLADLLAQLVGPGLGLEVVSNVNNIPKGSRLAVSTSLLACLISVCMRATGQTCSLTGSLNEGERRIVAARAILGEWLGGSGGGWQDSGGVWPGIKLIQGVTAHEGDPEFGISRGCLLPSHQILDSDYVSPGMRQKLQESLVLVHGGMAQNVGPILEMVTEKYLLRSSAEWHGRREAMRILDDVLFALKQEDVRQLGRVTTRNFRGPIQAIIPWASNEFTETVIERVEKEFGPDFWGFWMLGGMSGGGMGFIFEPSRRTEAQKKVQAILSQAKRERESALPFAMEPVVYDFAINERGTSAECLTGTDALLPPGYYALLAPSLIRMDQQRLPAARRAELDVFAEACRNQPALRGMVQALFDRLLPRFKVETTKGNTLEDLLQTHGFDPIEHEQIRTDLIHGRIGLAQNRLPATTQIEDVHPTDIIDLREHGLAPDMQLEFERLGLEALRAGGVAVVSLAAGAGSRWTQGAGVVKALHPFCKLAGKHRTFLEVHLAKSRRIGSQCGTGLPHLVTTSYLTHEPVAECLARHNHYNYPEPVLLSPGRTVGLRLIPTLRDLQFAWQEMPQQLLDDQAQKVRDSLRAALMDWARQHGEGADYRDNLPTQCLHPVGHWYEVPNLFRNGVLARLLRERPQLKHLLLHNIDTVGTDAAPLMLGAHIHADACLSFEVISRRLEDRGGGLARVNGQVRLVEGLAMPREEDEFHLSYYNTMTTWIHIDHLLQVFGLTRSDLQQPERVATALRALAVRLPTYVTLKEVKKRWGHGQEDVFPVAQFEKLWSDMTALPEVKSRFLVVSRNRGQQLKEQAQLDGWLRDGSADYVTSLCEFP
ncbi:MAG TPA: UTP--glucose-1-phosphate uridylyltransferase [Candidatus Paceibacterota bacterium]|nr:UTP--glucose-1-phosphate uridylyltransferase [Candidatus Paceibacterota bacterium]